MKLLSRYNIPDPITGGLLFATVASVVWVMTDYRVAFDQTVKPVLLLMFFAGVGMCADLSKLKQGGKALVIFLLVLLPFIIVQNAVGVGVGSCWTCIRSSGWSAAPSRWSADTEPAPPMQSALPKSTTCRR